MLARTVIYHDEYRGPLAMLVTKVQEDGTLDGTLFPDGSMRGEPVQGVLLFDGQGEPSPGMCTLPSFQETSEVLGAIKDAHDSMQAIADRVEGDAHKADLAADRSLDHQHKAEEAATKAEAAAKPAPKTTKGTAAKK